MAGSSAEVMWDVPGSFAWGVFHERHPRLIHQLGTDLPLTAEQRHALGELLDETLTGTVRPLPADAPDAGRWAAWGAGRYGRPWGETSFLWAESYFYRRLLGALGYFDQGTWHGLDPFGPAKAAELHGGAVDAELAGLDDLPESAPGSAGGRALGDALLTASLWGNRADLGFRITAGRGSGPDGPLLADGREAIWKHLAARPGRVCLVADNAGPELLPDLVLVDHLLHTGLAEAVVLHVKPHPYYVSDATPADTYACLRRLRSASGAAAEVGERLWREVESGCLVVRAHPFSCAPLGYADMPDDLRRDFAAATLTVMKGDLNYRRLVGDRHWPATRPFADAVAHFPGPVAALRTLKSDVAVGLDAATEARLDADEPGWRTSGRHALIQARL
ncbi:damage-control phosphatase ARMT1 family protein [Streptodolium elevatio]|uniref:Damage-control phosphatase ARMT1 family protein n=1 Tax=Streptodolium elevatio TaxID=3157996 RepID=A0ABV3DQB7_9ACTN